MNHEVVLITGAARRVGAAIAKALHAEGMDVVLHYHHSEQDAKLLCHHLNQKRPNSAQILMADLLKTQHSNALIQRAAAVWGHLDGLVNNASSFYPTLMGKVTEVQWDDLIGTNLKAPFFLSQAAYPFLNPRRGTIVNITDIYADSPRKDYPVYSIAKAGLAALTRALAMEFAPEVRVNGVAPGAILWPERPISEEEKTAILSRIPLQRTGNPDDIAQAVLFLIRDAEYMTGQILTVDGGRSVFG